MSIASWQLAVTNLAQSLVFYCDGLGFECEEANEKYAELFLGGGNTKLRLIEMPELTKPFTSPSNHCYWKIGLTVCSLDKTLAQLRKMGVHASQPKQFLDIGYLCHLHCPDGYVIELLQFTAEGKPLSQNHTHEKQWAHITFRISGRDASLSFFQDKLGLSLLESIAVEPYQFDLYFLTNQQEKIPTFSTMTERREWLWTRPYTLIELQHSRTPVTLATDEVVERQMALSIMTTSNESLLSPDGIRIQLVD